MVSQYVHKTLYSPGKVVNVLALRPQSNIRIKNDSEECQAGGSLVEGLPLHKRVEEEQGSSASNGGNGVTMPNSSHHNKNNGKCLKLRLLALLVAQGSSAILVGRYTRSSVPEDELYEIGQLVFVIEWVKFIASCIAEHAHTGGHLLDSIDEHVLNNLVDSLKVLVPAILYLVQNTLVYISLSNLTAPVFISLQQGKLITTAIVSVFFFDRTYTLKQWMCLCSLAVGVSFVALDERGEYAQSEINLEAFDDFAEGSADTIMSKLSQSFDEEIAKGHSQRFIVGVLAVTGACFSSAFAGVYFEKVLAPEKSNQDSLGRKAPQPSTAKINPTSQPSLWMRNIQLSFFSIIFAHMKSVYDTRKQINQSSSDDIDWSKPYLHGFTSHVWLLVALQAGGGLLVSAVMKHADNVLKGLAMGVSVVIASVLSNLLFDVHLSSSFALGACVILVSVYCFSNNIPCLP